MALDDEVKTALDTVNDALAKVIDSGAIGPQTMRAAEAQYNSVRGAPPLTNAIRAEIATHLSQRIGVPVASNAFTGADAFFKPPPQPTSSTPKGQGGDRKPDRRGGGAGASADAEKPATAPYRTIPLPDAPVLADPQPDGLEDDFGGLHDRPAPDGFCGEIRFVLEAETPLLVGDHDRDGGGESQGARPMCLPPGDRYILPGASLKGMLRSFLEVATDARLAFYTPAEQKGEAIDALAAASHPHHRTRLNTPVDLVEALFGYVREPDEPTASIAPRDLALKGRVSVGCAWLSPETPAREAPSGDFHKALLSSPNIFCRPFYRAKDQTGATRLAGRKRYVARFAEPVESFKDFEIPTTGNPKFQSPIRFLEARAPYDAPLRFEGALKIHNLTPAEVGMLLWALTHGGATDRDGNKPFRHLIGRAKSYGAGQMRLVGVDRRLTPNGPAGETFRATPSEIERRAHGGEGFLTAGEEADWSMQPFLAAFQTTMRRAAPDWPNTPAVRGLLTTAAPGQGAMLRRTGALAYNEQTHTKALKTRLDETPGPYPGAVPAQPYDLGRLTFLA